MKKIIITCLLVINVINQTSAQEQSYTKMLPLSCAASLVTVAMVTAWDYATGNIEKDAIIGENRLKKFLRRIKHNIIYIGIPTGIVASTLLYASGMQHEQVSEFFWPTIGKKTLSMLPAFLKKMVTSVDDQGNIALNGPKNTINNFTKEYGSTIETTLHTVAVNILGSMVYVSKEVAHIIKNAILAPQK